MPDRWGTWFLSFTLLCAIPAFAQPPSSAPAESAPAESSSQPAEPAATPDAEAAPEQVTQEDRRSLNLLGQTNTSGGESRRNQNIQINLVNNNAAQELNTRVGTTATIIEEFEPDRGYFSAEYGNAPRAPIHSRPQLGVPWHGNAFWTHNNSIFSARSFFQVGSVQPARENQYGGTVGAQLWRGGFFNLTASQDRTRGQVNGNVLIPLPEEHTPLTMDPATRAVVQQILDGYPLVPPNRPDINPRAHNINALQLINTDTASGQLTQQAGSRDRVMFRYAFTGQRVDAFQFVRGQNPNTRNKSHSARITWSHTWNPSTVADFSAGFDRQGALLTKTPDSLGPIPVTGIQRTGPSPSVPLDRAQNRFRYAGSLQHIRSRHTISAGASLTRFQYNGEEPDGGLGIMQFRPDFGRDAITNLRLGTPSLYVHALGTTYRGFRAWEMSAYVGDHWAATGSLTLSISLNWDAMTKPFDVTGRSDLKFDSDLNNFAPRFGFAYRLPGRFGVVHGAYGVMFGQIYPATYGQDRLNLPYNVRLNINTPDLANPTRDLTPEDFSASARSALYDISPDLATPYSHQYNLSWEFEPARDWHLQLGYVGSRSHKLFLSYALNRAVPVAGIPFTSATINQRRPDQNVFEQFLIHNATRAYYDAGLVSFHRANWHGLSINASYWWSKALDLGSDYTATASGGDVRSGGGQDGINVHADLKGRSDFDQPHSMLLQTSYDTAASAQGWLGALTRNWSIATVFLLKSGTPFTVESGSDGLNVGNLDGSFGDRPMLLDPSILGRSIGDPRTSGQRLPASAFRFINAPEETAGNVGRNTFRKGKIANLNASLSRTWALPRDGTVTLRAESVNFLNTPQFAEPGSSLAAENFGQINNTLNDGRTFRFTLRLAF